jgi:Flp pilus assembly protein TadG
MSHISNNRGTAAVLISVLLVVFLGFLSLAVDVAHRCVAINHCQNAADAAALAAASYLYETGQPVTTNTGIISRAIDVAAENGFSSELVSADIGIFNMMNVSFFPGGVIPNWPNETLSDFYGSNRKNAVRVTVSTSIDTILIGDAMLVQKTAVAVVNVAVNGTGLGVMPGSKLSL